MNINKIVILWLVTLSGCAKTNLFETPAYHFPGLDELIDNNNGTFTLNWQQVPTADVTYSIYSRLKSGSYNFNANPSAQTTLRTYTTKNLRFAGDTCFTVRFSSADGAMVDSNTTEKCTGKNPYEFKGLESISISDQGVPTLRWTAIPQDGVAYNIYMTTTPGTYDFTNAYKSTTSATFDVPVYPITSKQCFVVRYAIADVAEDVNTKEVCPDLVYISGFSGVSTATSVDTGTAVVSWIKPTTGMNDVKGYRVYKGTDFKSQVGSADSHASSVVVTGLAPDSTETLGVRAFDSYGREDTNTKTVSVNIVNNQLPNFGGVDLLTSMSSTSIKVSWAAADIKPAKYNIYKKTGAANATLTVESTTPFDYVDSNTLFKTLTGLGDEQSHCFMVKAETSGGQKDINSIVKCLTLPDNGAPVFSGLNTLTFSSGGAQLSWDAAVGETAYYKVYYQQGTTLDFNTASTMTITAPATTANITGLADNRDWTFAVRAVDSRNNYDTNVVKKTATAGDLTPPVFAGYVSATAVSETGIQLIFNRSTASDTDHYDVRVRLNGTTDSFQTNVSASQVSSGTITTNITNLLPARSYDILVTAFDTAGNPSTNSSFLTRATLDQTPPNFGGVTTAAKKTTDITKMVVNWTAATDAGGLFEYRVYYSTQSLVGKTLVRTATYPLVSGGQTIYMSNSVANSATSLEISGLTANTTYYFVVHAVDNSGNEDANTIEASALVPSYTAPSAVTGLSFNPAPGSATTNRVPYVNGTGTVGNTAFVYVDGVAAGSQQISAGGTFSIQLSLPNTSKVYVVTATQKNIDLVESTSATVGNYNLQVTAPTATLSGAPTEGSTTNTLSFSATVGGANATHYKWGMVISGSDCTSATRSSLTAVATDITGTLASEGSWKLCVWAQDALENEQPSATTRIWTADITAPTVAATITGAPTGVSASNVSITIGGSDITQYRYVYTNQSTACSDGGLSYSNWTPVATLITTNPTFQNDIRLCVRGADAALNPAPYGYVEWTRITSPPTLTAVSLTDKTTGSTTMTNVAVVNAVLSGSGSLFEACFRVTSAGTQPAPGDGCWGSKTQLVTLPGTGANNVYGWGRDAYGNITTSAISSSITWTNYCDNGNFDGICTISATKTIPNGAKLGGTGNLLMVSGGIFNMTATHSATITLGGNVTVENGGQINGNYTINAVNVEVQAGGVISANSLGHTGTGTIGTGLGGGANGPGSGTGGVGGSHGGLGGGGVNNASTPADVYGSPSQPTTFGSAAGAGQANTGSIGGAGGGALKFNLTGNLTVGGTVSANGADFTCLWSNGGVWAGSGAGGSIWIIAQTLTGAGTITADGGLATANNSSLANCGGAGGGGRIAFDVTNYKFSGLTRAQSPTLSNSDVRMGTSGSFYLVSTANVCDTGTLSNSCAITSNRTLPNGFAITGSGSLSIDTSVTVKVLNPTESISIAMAGNVTINGTVLANITSLNAANVTIGASGLINVAALGHPGGRPGLNGKGLGGGVHAASYGGGGGHGGVGGLASGAGSNGGSVDGSTTNPTTMGGGGAGSNCAAGGNGGGIVTISTTGTLTIDGAINANGGAAQNKSGSCLQAGAGAGGTIHLTAGLMAGSGSISAKGGNPVSSIGGGGGGGRIYFNAPNPFRGSSSASVSVAAGGVYYNSNNPLANLAGPGTIHYATTPCDIGTSSDTCTINNYLHLPLGSTLTGSGNLVIANGGMLFTSYMEKASISFAGNVTVQSGGSIIGNLTLLSAANVSVSGTIDASGLGYYANGYWGGLGSGFGTGSLNAACWTAGAGGGYGGNGGTYTSIAGGSNFGSASKTQPTQFGSSGGGTYNSSNGNLGIGGYGGGAIRINTTGTVTVAASGSIKADGKSGVVASQDPPPGGGSGGSIWITSSLLEGSGLISAKGGNGLPGCGNNNSTSSGPGGGGRMSLEYTTSTFSGTSSVAAGAQATGITGTQAGAGGVGSLCINGGGGGCIN